MVTPLKGQAAAEWLEGKKAFWDAQKERPTHDMKDPRESLSPGQRGRVDWIDKQTDEGEREFLEMLEDTGRVQSLDNWAELDKQMTQTELASIQMADRMERLGLRGYGEGDPTQFISVHTGCIKEIANFRQCNLIPASAQKKRNPTLKSLIFFVDSEGMEKFRHIVIHNGGRCHAGQITARHKQMKRAINKWNKLYAPIYGAEFIFYSCEAGSPVKKSPEKVWDKEKQAFVRPYIFDANGKRIRCVDAEGKQTWHPHIHALLMMPEFLPKPQFEAMCDDLRRVLDSPEFLYNEPLENTREACKYLVKCDELNNCDDEGFKDFCVEMEGARLVQTMGKFAAFRKMLKRTGRVVRMVRNKETGKSEYQAIKNWNRNAASDVCDPTEGEDLERNIRQNILDNAGPLTKPAIISRIAPSNMFSPVSEPVFLVRGRCTDLAEFCERPQVKAVIELTRELFEGGCQDFKSDTGVSLEQWLKSRAAAAIAFSEPVEAPIQPDFGEFSASSDLASGVSAHNTSTTGHSKRAEPPRGETEAASAPPVGPPKAVSSNSEAKKPPSQSQPTDFDSPGCLRVCPDEAEIVDYF